MKKTFPCLLTALLYAVSYGVDLKCDIDLCGTNYLKTIMDHPDGRCRAADAFEACVKEACKDSPINGKVNYVYIGMELFGITSCTKDFNQCAMQKGQHCQEPLEVSQGSESFGIEPREVCSALNKVIVCLSGICDGNPDSFVQNMNKKHNIICDDTTLEEQESFNKCAKQKGKQCQQPLEESQGSLSFDVKPQELCSTLNKVIVCLRGICDGNSDSFVQNFNKMNNLTCAPPVAVSRGVSLKCDIDLCGTSYLKTIMDHPDGRCRTADAFKSCVHEACKDSANKHKINYVTIAMELFGITSCTKDMYYY